MPEADSYPGLGAESRSLVQAPQMAGNWLRLRLEHTNRPGQQDLLPSAFPLEGAQASRQEKLSFMGI